VGLALKSGVEESVNGICNKELKLRDKCAFMFTALWIRLLYRSFELEYEACPESEDTKVFNMCNIFNLQKRHCE
jgi:hypothetical protein